jgi:hypothetical protein
MIDRYGQWISENWPGKTHDEAQLRTLWEADTIAPPDFPFYPADRKLQEFNDRAEGRVKLY